MSMKRLHAPFTTVSLSREGIYIGLYPPSERSERTNRVNGANGERMSRAIPRVAKDEAFKLWLGGCSYREIRGKTGMSLGSINELTADIRGKAPDVDQLRELNLILRKGGSNVYDAMRGGRLLDKVGQLGAGLDELENYIKLTERISSEKEVEVEGFVQSAVRLTHLEEETGKTYGEVIKDFEGKLSESVKLEAKIDALKGEIQSLTEAKVKLEGELTKAKGDLTQIVQEMKRTVASKERLDRLGLEKLNALTKFIEDFEALNFDAKMAQSLAMWRKSLIEMGIDPNGLKRFVEEKGPLEKQISSLKSRAEDLRGLVKKLEKKKKSLRIAI